MPFLRRVTTWALILASAMLLTVGWATTALAQADGDGLDSDELGLPIVLGVGLLILLGWTVFSRRRPKPPA